MGIECRKKWYQGKNVEIVVVTIRDGRQGKDKVV